MARRVSVSTPMRKHSTAPTKVPVTIPAKTAWHNSKIRLLLPTIYTPYKKGRDFPAVLRPY